jgi:type IV pilus assembly PilX-like protein
MQSPHDASERGIALVITLLALAFLGALGVALVLTTATDRLTSGNEADTTDALDAAEAAIELAARELALIDDWNDILSGVRQSRLIDGLPTGVRTFAAGSLDLTVLTSQITCSRPVPCTDLRIRTSTAERPWGDNNPRWQPFLYGPLANFTDVPDAFPGVYIIVWIGDDAREIDGNPLVDSGGSGQEGRFVVRAHAEAFTRAGSRRSIDADMVRPCELLSGEMVCSSGIRVQSWRVSTRAIP